jgi:hypothetical protein
LRFVDLPGIVARALDRLPAVPVSDLDEGEAADPATQTRIVNLLHKELK